MSQWEREALAKCPQKPTFFLRFLDDIIGAWSHGEETFCKVIDVLNNQGEIWITFFTSKLSGHNCSWNNWIQIGKRPRSISNPQIPMLFYISAAIILNTHLKELSNLKLFDPIQFPHMTHIFKSQSADYPGVLGMGGYSLEQLKAVRSRCLTQR